MLFRGGAILFSTFCSLLAIAQADSLLPNPPLCSAIREVIFSAHQHQFKNLMNTQTKGSYGYQVQGSWRFETTQYETLLAWPEASKTYIDHSEEKTDSSLKLTRQYVAEFKNLPTTEVAQEKFKRLNEQITTCKVLLADTQISVLKPLPLSRIKDDLPVAAIDARLYPVTIKQADAASPAQEVVIMTAYEKTAKFYHVYMIVEYRLLLPGNSKNP
jgi:hypothetical protein